MTSVFSTARDLEPVLLGYTTGPRANGQPQKNRQLHLSDPRKQFRPGPQQLACSTNHSKTIDVVAARVVGTDGSAPTMYDILTTLIRLDIASPRLCRSCFDAGSWSIVDACQTAKAVADPDAKPVTVDLTWTQIATMAYLVATTDQQRAPLPELAEQPSAVHTAWSTLTLTVTAHAVIAGFVAADDEQDRDHGVNVEGIITTDGVWKELRTRFPFSAYQAWARMFPSTAPQAPMLLIPLRALFPLSKFWGFAATGTEDDLAYDPYAGY